MASTISKDRRSQSPQSVTRVIRILEALCASPLSVSLADLSRELDLPKSSLAALLRGLADEQLVVNEGSAWRLGPGAFGLGSALTAARRRYHSSDVIRDGMRRLAERSGETVLLGVLDAADEMMTYVDIVESRNAVRFARSVGDRRPLYATAGGRALLAARDEAGAQHYLDRVSPKALTASTLTGKGALVDAIADARASGYAQTVDQASDGVTGTAAALRDASGEIIGALVVAAPSSRLQDQLEELARLVIDEAESISRNLGYRVPG